MLSNLKRFYRPRTIAEALALLEKNSGSILIIAGGTKLVQTDNAIAEELVDVTSLKLNNISEEAGSFRIGATTTLQKLVENPTLNNFASGIVANAAAFSHRSKMIRNVSTLGGELITTGPFSVLYCALLVLQAQVRIAGGDEFALAINIFLNKKKLAGGLLVEVLIPQVEPQTFAAMIPIFAPKRATPLICACARISVEENLFKSPKIAITGTASVPQRLHEVEDVLEGQEISQDKIDQAGEKTYNIYSPVSDNFASAEYRKEVGRILVKRAIKQCLKDAEISI